MINTSIERWCTLAGTSVVLTNVARVAHKNQNTKQVVNSGILST